MDINKFQTEEVMIYKEAEHLIARKRQLESARDILHDNYDSVLVISAYAHSSYNGDQIGSAKEDIPLDILFDTIPTKKDMQEKLTKEINKLDKDLLALYIRINDKN